MPLKGSGRRITGCGDKTRARRQVLGRQHYSLAEIRIESADRKCQDLTFGRRLCTRVADDRRLIQRRVYVEQVRLVLKVRKEQVQIAVSIDIAEARTMRLRVVSWHPSCRLVLDASLAVVD